MYFCLKNIPKTLFLSVTLQAFHCRNKPNEVNAKWFYLLLISIALRTLLLSPLYNSNMQALASFLLLCKATTLKILNTKGYKNTQIIVKPVY